MSWSQLFIQRYEQSQHQNVKKLLHVAMPGLFSLLCPSMQSTRANQMLMVESKQQDTSARCQLRHNHFQRSFWGLISCRSLFWAAPLFLEAPHSKYPIDKVGKRRDSNPGLLSGNQECCLYATPSQEVLNWFIADARQLFLPESKFKKQPSSFFGNPKSERVWN